MNSLALEMITRLNKSSGYILIIFAIKKVLILKHLGLTLVMTSSANQKMKNKDLILNL